MDIVLPIAYIAIFILQVILLCMCLTKDKKSRWIILYTSEVASTIIAITLSIVYNNLEGYGMMPGLTYLAEAIFSMCAMVMFSSMLLVSILAGVIKKLKNR